MPTSTLRRGLIRLPFGNLLAKGGAQRSQQWQRVVSHPRHRIFNVVAQVEQYEQFLPWCLSSRVLAREAGTLSTEIVVGYGPLQSTFLSTVELEPERRVHAVSQPNEHMERLSFTWGFEELGASACRLDLTLDFELKNPEHILMWDFAQDKVVSEYVRCFSQRCVDLEKQKGAAASL